jgi:hypothetical protein
MQMHTASGRSRWPYVIGCALVIVAIAGGIGYAATQPAAAPPVATPSATPTPTAPATGGDSGAGDDENDVAPTGCLGGSERNAAMVLAAQQQAKHTTFGAVEVATSFYRFLWQYPYPPASELQAVSGGFMAAGASSQWVDLARAYGAAGDNPSQGVVPAGTPFYTSSTNGLWRVTEDSTSDRITVDLAVGYVIDGALSPTEVAGMGMVMVWENDAWRFEAATYVDQDKLAAGGNRYTGGC